MRVIDGMVAVFCAVGGVEPQSETVWYQAERYKVPRIAFINKCDRSGANPNNVINQLKTKLGHNAIPLQLAIGLEDKLEGVIDLIKMNAIYFEGGNGEKIKETKIPKEYLDDAQSAREEMLDAISLFSDELTDAMLNETEITEELIYEAIRNGTLSQEMTPVFVGSAFKNKGVQPLLDAVIKFLPAPSDINNEALDIKNEEKTVTLESDIEKPTVALAFKLEDGQYGQLTYMRIYQGTLNKADTVINARTNKKLKIGRIVKMHSNQMEDTNSLKAGQIGALFGVDCASGDTFTDPKISIAMTSMFVPEPVISLAINPKDNKAQINMSKALNRFMKEDPTFKTFVDEETNETIIEGMGELHLEIYIERMKREYKAEVEVGKPRVAYREAITRKATFNYIHKKQTGGAGQFGRVAGFMEPFEEPFKFVNKIVGGKIPIQFIPSCEKGFSSVLPKGPKMGLPVTGISITINDGSHHAVDSSDNAFQAAARGAFLEAYAKAKPIILEPIMKVVVETPNEFQGVVVGSINQKRGMIVNTQDEGHQYTIESNVPLSEMFGYSTDLRSLTQGKAQFTMEFFEYQKVPMSIMEELQKKYDEEKAKK